MHPSSTGRPQRRIAAALAATAAPLGLLGTIYAAPAQAIPDVHGCGANEYVESIDVVSGGAAEPNYQIVLTPTDLARAQPASWDVTVSMWHQVQSCVPGLYGDLADSIWQQIECHQAFDNFGGGPTYDLESWRPPLDPPSTAAYINTHCLNTTDLIGNQQAGSPQWPNNFPGHLDINQTVG